MKAFALIAMLSAALAAGGCGSEDSSGEATPPPAQSGAEAKKRSEPKIEPASGPPPKTLVIEDLIEGSGAPAGPGDTLTVNYIGVAKDDVPFSNSWESSRPLTFQLGVGKTMLGWEKGLRKMRVGGRRELTIPPSLTQTPGWPRSASEDTLVYVVDLLGLEGR